MCQNQEQRHRAGEEEENEDDRGGRAHDDESLCVGGAVYNSCIRNLRSLVTFVDFLWLLITSRYRAVLRQGSK